MQIGNDPIAIKNALHAPTYALGAELE